MTTATARSPFPPQPPGWMDLDIKGLASQLKCSKYWVRDQVTAGALPHYRLGKVKGVRFTWEHVCEIRAVRERRPADRAAVSARSDAESRRLDRSIATLRRARAARAA